MRKNMFLVGAIFLGYATLAWAQGLEVSGKVTLAESGDPIPAATVAVKGTTLNTVTDSNGNFKLEIPGVSQATIQVSYVGFQPVQQVVSGNVTNLEISLDESGVDFSEEVIATGFATGVKRRNLANAVASLNAEQIARAPTQTLDGALSGKFSGVTVSQNTGAPGGGISVNLRGTSTLIGATQPLFVVDGLIINNSEIQSGVNEITEAAAAGSRRPQDQPSNRIADIIPSDIESIEILKGPSAAAIYGAKASNGVVIITTKRGRAGETQYEFGQSFGQREIIKRLGVRRFTAETALSDFGETGLAIFNEGNFVDYEDEIYGNTGDIYETTFSARGGSDKTFFYFSGTALNDEGIVKRTGYDKYSLRLNLDHDINSQLSVGVRSTFISSKARRGLTGNDNTGATFGVSIANTPSFWDGNPVDGVYPNNPYNGSNPIQLRDLMKNEEVVNRTITSGVVNWNIFQTASQSLDFNLTGGVDYFSMEGDARFPNSLQFEQASDQPGTVVLTETESTNNLLYLNLTHSLFTSGGMSFTTTAGIQYEDADLNYVANVGNNLIEGQFNLDQAAAVNVSQNRIIQRDRGFFLQEEVSIGEALFFTAAVRGDSSSANGDEDKFYTYPKGSVSLRLSEFGFWDAAKELITEFKVRAAYGETGNLPIPRAKFSTFVSENIDGNGGLIPGTSRGNADIEPEESSELEFGFDMTFKNGKANFEFTYFQQDVSNLLLERDLPSSSGFVEEIINGGEMEISGIEATYRMVPVKTPDWNWAFGINYYKYEAEVTRLDVPEFTDGGFADFLGNFLIKEGLAPTTIIGAERDANGDFIPLGDAAPDFQIGWDNIISYRNWGLSWLIDWKEGGENINLTVLLSDLGNTTADLDTNPNARDRLNNLGVDTTPFIQDAGYIRLRELKLQYDLDKGILNNIAWGKLDRLRFSLSGRNLWTDTDYMSYDPEVSNFGSVAIGRSVEVTPFPSSKAWYFNVNVGI